MQIRPAATAGPAPAVALEGRRLRLPDEAWPQLLKKVFAIDVLACPECSGRLKMIAFIDDHLQRLLQQL